MDPVQKSLNKVKEMMSTFKANREDTTLEIQLACARTEISRKQEHQSIASFIIDECD